MLPAGTAKRTRTIGETASSQNFRQCHPVFIDSPKTSSPPGVLDEIGGIVRDGHDRQHRVKTAVGHVNARIHYKQVVHVMKLAMFVNDGCFRVVAHAACPSLMLARAERGPRLL